MPGDPSATVDAFRVQKINPGFLLTLPHICGILFTSPNTRVGRRPGADVED